MPCPFFCIILGPFWPGFHPAGANRGRHDQTQEGRCVRRGAGAGRRTGGKPPAGWRSPRRLAHAGGRRCGSVLFPAGKAAVNAPHSRRFARLGGRVAVASASGVRWLQHRFGRAEAFDCSSACRLWESASGLAQFKALGARGWASLWQRFVPHGQSGGERAALQTLREARWSSENVPASWTACGPPPLFLVRQVLFVSQFHLALANNFVAKTSPPLRPPSANGARLCEPQQCPNGDTF